MTGKQAGNTVSIPTPGQSQLELIAHTILFHSLIDSKDNAMVICHALTGSSDVEDW